MTQGLVTISGVPILELRGRGREEEEGEKRIKGRKGKQKAEETKRVEGQYLHNSQVSAGDEIPPGMVPYVIWKLQ